ncbi:MAG: esterase family protein [Dysgonamonadaceae bacterium]|jgi:S-formylglutathione hydrolase FrmB|nr:esterase family protein [Dysgonamonadaceae bacterium]
MKSIFTLLLAIAINFCYAAQVDTVSVFSNSMQKNIKASVVTPNGYDKTKKYPVIYLLHGYSGNHTGWLVESVAQNLVDEYNIIIVCPDGGFSSWYFDSPIDKSSQYETYFTKELIPWIDKNYNTVTDKNGRGITGLSMGGHGALYLSFRHQDLFGTAGSMSGGVDIRPFPDNWDISKRLGSYKDNQQLWEENTVVNMLHLLTPNSLALIIDCGTADFFYQVNCKLHEKMLYMNIAHDFISRPGAHDWNYWKNAVKYQMLFMTEFFKRNIN